MIPPRYYDGTNEFVDDWNGWYGYRALYGAAFDEAAFYSMWSFVPADDIYAPSIGVDLISPALYGGFIGRTAGWTRFGSEHGHLVNRSIDGARFRASFGHGLPSSRHEFATHHGPIGGPERGRTIAAHTHETVGVGHHGGLGSRHALATHSGSESVHHMSSTSRTNTRGGSFGHSSGSGHSRSVYSRSTGAAYSRSTGAYSRSSGAAFSRSGAGGYANGGGYARSSYGGASRTPAQSGFAQRSNFGGGMTQQRSMNAGGFARAAPQARAPAQGNTQRHH